MIKKATSGNLHDQLKAVYTLLILHFGGEIGNLKLGKAEICK